MHLEIIHCRVQSWSTCSDCSYTNATFIFCSCQLPQSTINTTACQRLFWEGVVVLLFIETDFTGSFSIVFFCNIRVIVCFSACILSALSSMCHITTWLSSHLSQSKRAGMWKICPHLPQCSRNIWHAYTAFQLHTVSHPRGVAEKHHPISNIGNSYKNRLNNLSLFLYQWQSWDVD